MSQDKTSLFDVKDVDNKIIRDILSEVAHSLEERGYRPSNQIVGYLISGDFSINVSLLTAYTYTLNNQVSGTYATLYDNQTYYTYSSGNSILENTSVYFIVYSYNSINFNVTIEIGDKVIYSATNVSNYQSQTFTVTDDLTITISPAENN